MKTVLFFISTLVVCVSILTAEPLTKLTVVSFDSNASHDPTCARVTRDRMKPPFAELLVAQNNCIQLQPVQYGSDVKFQRESANLIDKGTPFNCFSEYGESLFDLKDQPEYWITNWLLVLTDDGLLKSMLSSIPSQQKYTINDNRLTVQTVVNHNEERLIINSVYQILESTNKQFSFMLSYEIPEVRETDITYANIFQAENVFCKYAKNVDKFGALSKFFLLTKNNFEVGLDNRVLNYMTDKKVVRSAYFDFMGGAQAVLEFTNSGYGYHKFKRPINGADGFVQCWSPDMNGFFISFLKDGIPLDHPYYGRFYTSQKAPILGFYNSVLKKKDDIPSFQTDKMILGCNPNEAGKSRLGLWEFKSTGEVVMPSISFGRDAEKRTWYWGSQKKYIYIKREVVGSQFYQNSINNKKVYVSKYEYLDSNDGNKSFQLKHRETKHWENGKVQKVSSDTFTIYFGAL